MSNINNGSWRVCDGNGADAGAVWPDVVEGDSADAALDAAEARVHASAESYRPLDDEDGGEFTVAVSVLRGDESATREFSINLPPRRRYAGQR